MHEIGGLLALLFFLIAPSTAMSLASVRCYFPKNSLQVESKLSIPVLIWVGLIFTVAPLFILLTPCVDEKNLSVTCGLSGLVDSYSAKPVVSLVIVIVFVFLPAVLTHVFCAVTKWGWDRQWTLPSWLVETFLLNYIGKVTSFDKNREFLILDILTDDETLYSGVYQDYFLEGGELKALCISNCIRFNKAMEPGVRNRRYLIPLRGNETGKMYFPIGMIRNFHAWWIERGQVFQVPLKDREDAKYLAWLGSVKWRMRDKIPFTVTAIDLPDDEAKRKDLYETILHELSKLRLGGEFDKVFERIEEFEQSSKC